MKDEPFTEQDADDVVASGSRAGAKALLEIDRLRKTLLYWKTRTESAESLLAGYRARASEGEGR